MPLCSTCQRKTATVHITKTFNGVEAEKAHYCKDCAPATGFEGLTLEQIEALSIGGEEM
jgi:protein-arginine kinase activator protein McsA